MVKRALVVFAIVIGIATLSLATAVWLLTRDEVRALRAIEAGAQPVPPLVTAAIIAAEDPLFGERERPSLAAWSRSLRASLQSSPRIVGCGPSPLAYTLVRNVTPRRRMLRWHFETTVSTLVVHSLFTPDELLRIYAHQVYLGKNKGRAIHGIQEASAFYFGKRASELTPAEAATLAALIRNPHHYLRSRARLDARRDRVLAEMHRRGAIAN